MGRKMRTIGNRSRKERKKMMQQHKLICGDAVGTVTAAVKVTASIGRPPPSVPQMAVRGLDCCSDGCCQQCAEMFERMSNFKLKLDAR